MKHSGKQNQRQSGDENRPSRCEACDKGFTKFSLTSSGSGMACQICRRVVCSKCSVAKKITMDVSDTGAVQQCSFHFCLSCLLKAKQQSGWEMALSTFEAKSESSASSGSSPASRLPPTPQTGTHRRDGRSYSTYAGTRGYQRGEIATKIDLANYSAGINRSTSDQTTSESRATRLPPASNEKFQS